MNVIMLLTIKSLSVCVSLPPSDWDCQETKHHLCTSHSLPLAGGKYVWLWAADGVFCSLFFFFSPPVCTPVVSASLNQLILHLFVRFAASAAGGPSCGASKTGDHGRAQCGHWGTRAARSPTHSVYTSTYSLPESYHVSMYCIFVPLQIVFLFVCFVCY